MQRLLKPSAIEAGLLLPKPQPVTAAASAKEISSFALTVACLAAILWMLFVTG